MMDKSEVLEGNLVLKVVKASDLPAEQIMVKGGRVKVLLMLQMRTSVGMGAPVTVTKVLVILIMALEVPVSNFNFEQEILRGVLPLAALFQKRLL